MIIDLILLTIFIVWFLATIYAQLKPGVIEAYDPLTFIPQWRFFAPTPAMHDTHLIYRDKTDLGEVTEWRAAITFSERGLESFFWNPERRERKILFDIVNFLIQQFHELGESGIRLSVPYISIVSYIAQCPHFTNTTETQFAIIIEERHHKKQLYTPTITSEFHRI